MLHRSFCPGNRASVDKTMEETFMRHSKSNRMETGLSGLCMLYGNYLHWIHSPSSMPQYVNETLQNAAMIDDYICRTHKDTNESEKFKSEKIVTRTQEAIYSFINPFDAEVKDNLVVLSSGAAVPDDIAEDILKAESSG